MLAINNKDSSLGISLFFATYGYYIEPVKLITLVNNSEVAINKTNSKKVTDFVVTKRCPRD